MRIHCLTALAAARSRSHWTKIRASAGPPFLLQAPGQSLQPRPASPDCCMSWVVSPAISKASKGRARLSQFITPCLPLTPRPPRFTFRDPRDDIGPTQASQDNLPSLRSTDWQPEFSSAVLHPNTLTGCGQFGGHSCRSHQRHIDARRSHRGHCPLANLLSHCCFSLTFPALSHHLVIP